MLPHLSGTGPLPGKSWPDVLSASAKPSLPFGKSAFDLAMRFKRSEKTETTLVGADRSDPFKIAAAAMTGTNAAALAR
jgi:hypothetical protein